MAAFIRKVHHYRLAKVAAKVAYLAALPELAGLAPAPSTVEVV